MKLDRELQLEILKALEEAHPDGLDTEFADRLIATHAADKVISNLIYLEGHDLQRAGIIHALSSRMWNFKATEISSRGRDFIADDGGLSAILGVVTIKLHEDTLKTLIATKIEGSDLPQPEKHRWTAALRELPAESTKHLVLKLIDLGFAHGHEALHALETYLHVGAGT